MSTHIARETSSTSKPFNSYFRNLKLYEQMKQSIWASAYQYSHSLYLLQLLHYEISEVNDR